MDLLVAGSNQSRERYVFKGLTLGKVIYQDHTIPS